MKSRQFLFFNNDCLGAYHAFRITHLLNVLLYVLTFLHGLPKLLDVNFYLFFKLILDAKILVYCNWTNYYFYN